MVGVADGTSASFSFAATEAAAGEARRTLATLTVGLAHDLRFRLQLLVSELVGNSVRHAGLDRGDEIQLCLTRAGRTLRVAVSDPGPGFQRDRRPAEPLAEGGRGLDLVDALAARWGVAPHAAGGTRVWFELELGDGELASSPPARAERPPRPLRVLVADDYRLFAESLAGSLRLSDAIEVVAIAGDGEAAVELAVLLEPDLALIDLRMPIVDGIEATRRILARGIPTIVVIISGLDDQQAIARALEAGARCFLSKDTLARDPVGTVLALTTDTAASTRARPPLRELEQIPD